MRRNVERIGPVFHLESKGAAQGSRKIEQHLASTAAGLRTLDGTAVIAKGDDLVDGGDEFVAEDHLGQRLQHVVELFTRGFFKRSLNADLL